MIHSIKLVLFFFGYQLLFSIIMTGVSFLLPLSKGALLGSSLFLSGLAFIIHLLWKKEISLKKTCKSMNLQMFFAGLGCIVGSILFISALSELIVLPDWNEEQFILISQSFFGLFSVAVIGPLAEEFLFRGAIMERLTKQGWRPQTTILVSAFIFGLIHFNPAQIPFAFFMGLVFGWITWRTTSLLPVIVGHILNNTLGIAQIYASTHYGIEVSIETNGLLIIAFMGLILMCTVGYWLARNLPVQQSIYNDLNNNKIIIK